MTCLLTNQQKVNAVIPNKSEINERRTKTFRLEWLIFIILITTIIGILILAKITYNTISETFNNIDKAIIINLRLENKSIYDHKNILNPSAAIKIIKSNDIYIFENILIKSTLRKSKEIAIPDLISMRRGVLLKQAINEANGELPNFQLKWVHKIYCKDPD